MTGISSRYEIRQLGPEHAQWASAIVIHSNAFHSNIFTVIYPENRTARFNAAMEAAEYLINHQIDSGLSFGIFDTEYRYRRDDSAAAQGKFHWDPEDDSLSGSEILERMDFPLVSVALAYDGFDKLDMNRLSPLIACLPAFGIIYHTLDKLDPRPSESWRNPAERNVLLMRNATSTRHEYEGQKLMSTLARHLMRTAAAKGFKTANIECIADRVSYVWANPPSPFRGEIVAQFETEDFEMTDEDGNRVNPLRPAKQRVTRVCTTFSEGA
ncbi:hypothetical protein N0V93_007668 [Gnomoniopsis smithogilvyi]|uniref:Uncharacterized protein n=1 Tax=Gnomoniopsis smithogilvyi TaxID=1191159 RepID=A0A9W8YLR3_9PEZI|nr:hypothetical protein N0V93_007668 [Gnomoniopsis smithogilvyi]